MSRSKVFIRKWLGISKLEHEHNVSQIEIKAILELLTYCQHCFRVVKIGEPYEYVGKNRVSHKECVGRLATTQDIDNQSDSQGNQ